MTRLLGSSGSLTGLLAACLCSAWCPAAWADTDSSETDFSRGQLVFEEDVRPVLKTKCGRCHGQEVQKAELNLTTVEGVFRGSVSGSVLTKGRAEESPLYEMIHEGVMPKDGKTPLTEREVETVRRWIAGGARTRTGGGAANEPELTQHDILPILHLRCTVCHGGENPKAGLDLRTVKGMLAGGESGPAIVPGRPEESLILEKVHNKEMPPPKKLIDAGVRPMEKPEIERLEKWIAAGAPVVESEVDQTADGPDPLVTEEDRQYWAFQPAERPAIPEVQHRERVRNPIDAFLLRKLEAKGLSLAVEADKQTLIRRVAFDLTGLPPKWEDVQRFLNDEAPGAYERMVERFLASPAYGERWGQYWLDLAGYADSEGKRNADHVRRHAWRYRDYVIRSFNADKPYDRFLLEQIAGDELVDYEQAAKITPEIEEKLVATGFLRMAPDGTNSNIVNTAAERMEVIRDEIDILGDAVLGLTIRCAQCHSHKYDPIPQRDYYRLVAVFKPAFGLYDWIKPSQRTLPHVSHDERQAWQEAKQTIESRIDNWKDRLNSERKAAVERIVEARLQKLSEEQQEALRKVRNIPENRRTEEQKKLAEKYEETLEVDPEQVPKLDAEFRKFARKADKEIDRLKKQIPPEPAIRALWDRGVSSPTYLFRRGEVHKPGRPVRPGVLSVLDHGEAPFDSRQPGSASKATGRRLAFARWLVQPDHPLTARVMVNRIWKHHFGEGIVGTIDNFGKTGAEPTHPELLDWLAREFVQRDWSIKEMHRLMLTSSAYRQVSQVEPDRRSVDPENKLLSRMPLKRMEAEVVRDSILKIAGALNPRRFGEPDPVQVRDDGLITSEELPDGGWRRSIYVRHRRKEMPSLLETFDRPKMIPNCVDRPESTVSSQALFLMNNGLIRRLARRFAERVQREVGSRPDRQIERVYRIALSREPTDREREMGMSMLRKLNDEWQRQLPEERRGEAGLQALSNYCHTVLNSAAFLYID